MASTSPETRHFLEEIARLKLQTTTLADQNTQLTTKLNKFSPGTVFQFQDLPVELRGEIYALTVQSPFPITRNHLLAYIRGSRRGFPGLLSSNLSIRAETFEAFLEVNTADIAWFEEVFGGVIHVCGNYIASHGYTFSFLHSCTCCPRMRSSCTSRRDETGGAAVNREVGRWRGRGPLYA
jgi:hypothetical protein